mmetsp:Transcript_92538/g.283337  ORF Transcript_92538/g.283337 Transcript_92538/m.283337 type:complete len:214 (-) Transcript_92538:632-1273(-)
MASGTPALTMASAVPMITATDLPALATRSAFPRQFATMAAASGPKSERSPVHIRPQYFGSTSVAARCHARSGAPWRAAAGGIPMASSHGTACATDRKFAARLPSFVCSRTPSVKAAAGATRAARWTRSGWYAVKDSPVAPPMLHPYTSTTPGTSPSASRNATASSARSLAVHPLSLSPKLSAYGMRDPWPMASGMRTRTSSGASSAATNSMKS